MEDFEKNKKESMNILRINGWLFGSSNKADGQKRKSILEILYREYKNKNQLQYQKQHKSGDTV